MKICRSGQADEEMQSGEETAATGEAGPSPAAVAAKDGGKQPVSDATAEGKQPMSDVTASAQKEDDAPPTEPEPRQESNLGSRHTSSSHEIKT